MENQGVDGQKVKLGSPENPYRITICKPPFANVEGDLILRVPDLFNGDAGDFFSLLDRLSALYSSGDVYEFQPANGPASGAGYVAYTVHLSDEARDIISALRAKYSSFGH